MTQAEALRLIHRPELLGRVHCRGGSSHQRRKEHREYVRMFAKLGPYGGHVCVAPSGEELWKQFAGVS